MQNKRGKNKVLFAAMLNLIPCTGCNRFDIPTNDFPTNRDYISQENNADMLERALIKFDPLLRQYLSSIPIYKCECIDVAAAFIGDPTDPNDVFPYIEVNEYWDSTLGNYYSGNELVGSLLGPTTSQPVFQDNFKEELIAHELLHIAQDHTNVDIEEFYRKIVVWYKTTETGTPSPAGINNGQYNGTNRLKYILWWDLYGKHGNPEEDAKWRSMEYSERYKNSIPGVEEFAYIGSKIILPSEEWRIKDRLLELPIDIIEYYNGIIDPKILRLRE